MATFTATLPHEHPVLFLSDPYADEAIPEDTSASFVTATPTCVAFRIRAYVDGETKVVLSDQPSEGTPSFTGRLATKERCLSLSDSNRHNYIMVPVSEDEVAIQIWADQEDDPDWVWVQIGSMAVF